MSDIGMILDRIGRKLVMEVAPKLEGDYSGGHAGMAGLMSVMAGEAWDGAADRFVTEIKSMRALLDKGGVQVDILAAASLRLSDLSDERNALAQHLITLQTQLEASGDDAANSLNAEIWAHLVQTADARMPSPPEFPDAED